MPIDFKSLDYDDPCALCKTFRRVLDTLISGQSVVRTRINGEEAEFRPANKQALEQRISELKDECAEKQGKPKASKRRAILFGYR